LVPPRETFPPLYLFIGADNMIDINYIADHATEQNLPTNEREDVARFASAEPEQFHRLLQLKTAIIGLIPGELRPRIDAMTGGRWYRRHFVAARMVKDVRHDEFVRLCDEEGQLITRLKAELNIPDGASDGLGWDDRKMKRWTAKERATV
jgi:hypothetical protein